MTRKINNSYTLGQSNAPTDGGDMLKTRGDGTLVWEGVSDTTYVPLPADGDRGVFAGGWTAAETTVNNIEYITISSTGNSTDFGDLLTALRLLSMTAANGGSGRGLFAGGGTDGSTYVNTIQYITIGTPSNATDFGDLTTALVYGCGTSNGTNDRGVFAGGNPQTNAIEYVTISSAGNASDFGDLTISRYGLGGTSNATSERGIFTGGRTTLTNTIDYITINTTGNATDFGDLTVTRGYPTAGSNGTNDRAVFGPGASGIDNVLQYVTVSSTGNATDFGDLSYSSNSETGGLANAGGN